MILSNFMNLVNDDKLNADDVDLLNRTAKISFVKKQHMYAIFQMTNASDKRKDKWKTYYYDEDGKRKALVRSTVEEIYLELFEIYTGGRRKKRTMKEVFEELMVFKLEELSRSPHTVYIDRQTFKLIDGQLQEMAIEDVSRQDIQLWITKSLLPLRPREEAFKRAIQLLSQIFELGIQKSYCMENLIRHIPVNAYYSKCNHTRKRNEEKQFSEEELEMLYQEASSNAENPRALMMIVSMETGLRIGELASLHRDDICGDYLHIHRQQILSGERGMRAMIQEVSYTKDERVHPHDGRLVPITDICRDAVEKALDLPGSSEFLFHDEKGDPIKKDSYNQYLHRVCERLGTQAKNNHAFRIAFNTRMINLGLSSSDRAQILGHAVQTNEKNYSLTDRRRLDKISCSLRQMNDRHVRY